MFDGPLMLRVNWPVVDTIHPQSNKFATGVNIKATGEYKLNYSPAPGLVLTFPCLSIFPSLVAQHFSGFTILSV